MCSDCAIWTATESLCPACYDDSPGMSPGQTEGGEASKGSSPAPSSGDERCNGEPGPGRGDEAPARVSISDERVEQLLRDAKYTDDPGTVEAVRKRLFGGGT
jgi:hypothetical protein